MTEHPKFREALRFWTLLGFISFGGPAGQIAIMHESLVEKKKWISERKFLHALNYCMLLPGPEAQQLATYIGWLLHGTRGGIAAGALFVLPSMCILLGLSILYVSFGSIPWVSAMFGGLKPAVIAIVALALIKIGNRALISPFHYAVAAAAFMSIFFLGVPFPFIILATVAISVATVRILPDEGKGSGRNMETEPEASYVLNSFTSVPGSGFQLSRLLTQSAAFLTLWIIPLFAIYLFAAEIGFWKTLTLFFTQAALVTFGGAYAILPFVAQVSVESLGWLSKLQMIDGLALGETTPGPLIMVLAFVGFMAGFHHYDGSVAMGSLALIVTTYYTFLPSFFFILAGGPIIERTQEMGQVKKILGMISAAVVGVILNLMVYLGKDVLFPRSVSFDGLDLTALIWVGCSLVALRRYNIHIAAWIGASALFGLAVHGIAGA